MAYLWVRPVATPDAAPNWATNSGEGWPFQNIATPAQYIAEQPCPNYCGCGTAQEWKWLDPVWRDYRSAEYPRMGEWPPPQPGTDYDTWVAQQRQWMPFGAIAYNGAVATDTCEYTLGVPQAKNAAMWIRFNWASSTDWPFVTAWTGIRVVAQISRWHYVTNDGTCRNQGKSRLVIGVYKHSAGYPTLPATWTSGNFVATEYEFSTFHVGNYISPYGAGTANVVCDLTVSPSGAWTIGEQDRYWVIIGQKLSTEGKPSGQDNKTLRIAKCWAAAIATLGGSPSQSSPDTIHPSVIG